MRLGSDWYRVLRGYTNQLVGFSVFSGDVPDAVSNFSDGSIPTGDIGSAALQQAKAMPISKSPRSIIVSEDGLSAFILTSGDTVERFTMSSPNDLDSMVETGQVLDLSIQTESARDISFSAAGDRLIVVSEENGATADIAALYSYSLSTPYDVTTGTYSNEYLDLTAYVTDSCSVQFIPSGNGMYVCGRASQRVHYFDLIGAFDVLTASYSGIKLNIEVLNGELVALRFDPTGVRTYLLHNVDGVSTVRVFENTAAFDPEFSTEVQDNVTVTTELVSDRTFEYVTSGLPLDSNDVGGLDTYYRENRFLLSPTGLTGIYLQVSDEYIRAFNVTFTTAGDYSTMVFDSQPRVLYQRTQEEIDAGDVLNRIVIAYYFDGGNKIYLTWSSFGLREVLVQGGNASFYQTQYSYWVASRVFDLATPYQVQGGEASIVPAENTTPYGAIPSLLTDGVIYVSPDGTKAITSYVPVDNQYAYLRTVSLLTPHDLTSMDNIDLLPAYRPDGISTGGYLTTTRLAIPTIEFSSDGLTAYMFVTTEYLIYNTVIGTPHQEIRELLLVTPYDIHTASTVGHYSLDATPCFTAAMYNDTIYGHGYDHRLREFLVGGTVTSNTTTKNLRGLDLSGVSTNSWDFRFSNGGLSLFIASLLPEERVFKFQMPAAPAPSSGNAELLVDFSFKISRVLDKGFAAVEESDGVSLVWNGDLMFEFIKANGTMSFFYATFKGPAGTISTVGTIGQVGSGADIEFPILDLVAGSSIGVDGLKFKLVNVFDK